MSLDLWVYVQTCDSVVHTADLIDVHCNGIQPAKYRDSHHHDADSLLPTYTVQSTAAN